MRKLPLRPYHGTVWLCDSYEEMARAYRRLCQQPYPYKDDPNGGRFIKVVGETVGDTKWLVFGASPAVLAHEFSHVLLHTFGFIGHNPTDGDGEPFCYMLSQLLAEAG